MQTILLILVIIVAIIMIAAIVFIKDTDVDMSMVASSNNKGYKKFSTASKFIMLNALIFVSLSLTLSIIWNRQSDQESFEFLNQVKPADPSTIVKPGSQQKKEPILPN